MQRGIVFLSLIVIAALLAVALGSALATAESGKTGTDELRVEVEPESKKALRGESYTINVTVYAEKPANISISFNTNEEMEEMFEVRPLENNIVNVTLGSGESRTFKFNITVKRTAYGNLTVNFLLKSNITQREITHKVEVLAARNVILNLTKKLANQKVSIRVSCDKLKNYTLVIEKTNKDGLIQVSEIPAFGKACNLTVILRTKLGAFLVNESIGIDLEKLPNSVIYPGYLVNTSLYVLALDGQILKAKNVFINITVNGNIDSFNLIEKKSFLFGLSERGESQRINVTVWIAAVKHGRHILKNATIEVRRGDRTVEVDVRGEAYSKSDNTLNVNVTVPVSKIMFNLYYFDEKGARRPLTSGVARLVKVEVPLVYNASAMIFERGVIKGVGESAVIVREYNGTPVTINVTIDFAGETLACGSVRLVNGTPFKCGGLEARLFLDGGETAIVIDTLSSPLRGRVEFDNVVQRVLYWGTVRLYGVPKDASGELKLGSSSIPFKCVSRQIGDRYVCEGEVFLWPLAFWPIQPEVTGELQVDGETYRLKVEVARIYAGVWGLALVALAVVVAVVVILVRRPSGRQPRERLVIYDERYDLG
jgi:hypothetical protein